MTWSSPTLYKYCEVGIKFSSTLNLNTIFKGENKEEKKKGMGLKNKTKKRKKGTEILFYI